MLYYKVTVNGNTYEVGVEEMGGAPEVKTVYPVPQTPDPAPPSKPATAGGASAPKAAPAPAAPAADTLDIMAPLPGTVVSINVAVGDQVKDGQVLMVFEAMKMENELMAPRDGYVLMIHVAKGDALESSKAVITIA